MGSRLRKPEAALLLVRRVMDAGIEVDYILMDSWFTNEPFIQKLRTLGLHVIGMVRNVKQSYLYQGSLCTLPQLAKLTVRGNAGTPYRSLVVRTGKHSVPVRIIFVQNQSKKSEFLYLLTTDLALSDDEVIRLYGNCWSIETFFKASKLCSGFAMSFRRAITILRWRIRHSLYALYGLGMDTVQRQGPAHLWRALLCHVR